MEGKSADKYIVALHSLAKDCDYGVFKSELVKDLLVVGILDILVLTTI